MDQNELQTLLKAQQGELDAVLMYNALADTVRVPRDAETFRRLASEEGRHAAVFKGLTGRTLRPKKTLATLLPVFYRLLGRKILYPVIAKFEYNAFDGYASAAEKYPEVQSVRADEKRHGDAVSGLLKPAGKTE